MVAGCACVHIKGKLHKWFVAVVSINMFQLMLILFMQAKLENPKKSRNVDDSMDDNMVKSSKIDPEVDETYEEAFGEDVQYDEDFGGYDYDQHYDDDEY